MPYDDLVKRLRDISNSDSKIKSNYIGLTMLQAADAIEELEERVKKLSCVKFWVPPTKPPKEET